jgi:hypothetical protein
MTARTLYHVEVTTENGPEISRFFETIKAARRWAKWCSKKWPTRIMLGIGGMQVF